MTDPKTCPECGNALPATGRLGICPRCVLGLLDVPSVSAHLTAKSLGLTHTAVGDAAQQGHDHGGGADRPPDFSRFGDYELLDEIARGGMGVVYRARQISLNRIVAVKMILAGPFATTQMVQRFRGEVTAAALLKHPHIVAIHEVGVHDGQHFFSMDYVEGQNLAQLVGNRPLPPKQAARYALILAQAIDYAHQQGVLHRDLKPSNVLVDAASDTPRLTDFGLAKRIDEASSITVTGQLVGSPNYMAPEQADATRGKPGRTCDIHGLGAILYFLLTGRPPFPGESLEATLHAVLHLEPVAPRLLNPATPPDLETLCLKCLEKEPARRYPSARELANDLQRYLDDEPILARPLTRIARAARWCRRKPLLASLAAALALALVFGTTGVLTQWIRAERANDENRRQLARLHTLTGIDALQTGDAFTALLWFTKALGLQSVNSGDASNQRTRIAATLQNAPRLVHVFAHDSRPIAHATFSPLDDRLATVGGEDRTVRVWQLPAGREIARSKPLPAIPLRVAFSPDAKQLAVVLSDSTVRLLDAASGEFIGKSLPHSIGQAGSIPLWPAFDPGSLRLVTQLTDGALSIWNLTRFEPVGPPLVHSNRVESIAFANNGRLLLTTVADHGVQLWHLADGSALAAKGLAARTDTTVFPDPASTQAVVAGRLSRFDAIPGQASSEFPAAIVAREWLLHASFSPDGTRVLTTSRDNTARIWDVHLATPLTPVMLHPEPAWFGAWSPDGCRVFTACADGQARVWQADTGRLLTPPMPHASGSVGDVFSGSGRYLLTMHPHHFAYVWDLHADAPAPALLPSRAIQDDMVSGSTFMQRDLGSTLRIFNRLDGSQTVLNPAITRSAPAYSWTAASGALTLLEGEHATVQVWHTASGLPLTPSVPSHYSVDSSLSQQVRLPTTTHPLHHLEALAQLLSGRTLDGRGGWKLLDFESLDALRDRFLSVQPASHPSPHRQHAAATNTGLPTSEHSLPEVGPGPSTLPAWHRAEARTAEAVADWSAARFHWQRLVRLSPGDPEPGPRFDFVSLANAAARAHPNGPQQARATLPPRDPVASINQIDLAPFYTASLAESFSDARRGPGLPIGLHALGGVTYDLRGEIALASRASRARGRQLPDRIDPIPVGHPVKRLHLLHAERWPNLHSNAVVIATFEIHYTDGQLGSLPIRSRLDLSGENTWTAPASTNSAIAWIGSTALTYAQGTILRLYRTTWTNPRPDQSISHLSLTSAHALSTYVLVGITTE